VNVLRNSILHWILGIVLGGAFLYASVPKIVHPEAFARIVYHYQIIGPNARIPPAVPNAFAVTLPFVEALSGGLLVAGLWRREAAGVVGALLLVFLAAVSIALYRGIDIENCGCFSVSGKGRAAGVSLLAEDAALLAAALVLAGVEPRATARP
jgi:uncharacterized membrane protein YphA (DoxX/SURF4 family)